jgi:hypothetical protein
MSDRIVVYVSSFHLTCEGEAEDAKKIAESMGHVCTGSGKDMDAYQGWYDAEGNEHPYYVVKENVDVTVMMNLEEAYASEFITSSPSGTDATEYLFVDATELAMYRRGLR